MFRILVVDDEPIAIKSIIHIIKNDVDPSIAVEKARNGREAIEQAWKIRPDIVITDIKMPGLSGLDVISEIKAQLQSTRFIILSAYEQFAFAKEAVALGVDEYLLKPVSRARMAEAVKKCIERVENDRSKLKRDLAMKERMEKMIPSIESGFLLSLLFFDHYDPKSGKDLLDLKNEGGCIIVAEMRITRPDAGYEAGRTFYGTCCDILKQYDGCLVCQLSALKIAAFIPARDDETGREKVKSIAGNLIERNRDKDAFFAIGAGSICRDLKGLKESYTQAAVALNTLKSDQSPGALRHIVDVKSDQPPDSYTADRKKAVCSKLAIGDLSGALTEIENIFNWHKKACKGDFPRLKEKMAEVLAMLVVKVYDAEIPENHETIAPILHAEGEQELLELCRAKVMELAVCAESNSKSRISDMVHKANGIIEGAYANEVTLEAVARELGITPSYFSRLYKQQTGYNFIDYLIKVRIEHAKRLFDSTDLSVKEISYMTGYIDPNYFSRLFKKATGMTPTEYKLQAGNIGTASKSGT
jgi:two-component system response regulator YesN